MNDIDRIRISATKYDEKLVQTNATEVKDDIQDLISLVEKYGVEKVSAASGLMISSLLQYTSKKNPPKPSHATVKKAKVVLSSF